MADQSTSSAAPPEQRTAAIEMVLRRHGMLPDGFVDDFAEHADDAWVTSNGARMVARAWTDPEFRTRMLADGTAAAADDPFGHRASQPRSAAGDDGGRVLDSHFKLIVVFTPLETLASSNQRDVMVLVWV